MNTTEITQKIKAHAEKIINHDIALIHNNIKLQENELKTINNYKILCEKLVRLEEQQIENQITDKKIKKQLEKMLEKLSHDTKDLVDALKIKKDEKLFEEKSGPYLKQINELLELESELNI